jgi:glycopeptide antibiotics resistance protein
MKNGGIMNKRERIETVFLYGVFICYILFLIKLLFLSRVSLLDLFNSQRISDKSINLIPFYSIKEYILSNSVTIKKFAFSNVGGNIIIFIPLGTCRLSSKTDPHLRLKLTPYGLNFNQFKTITF